MVSLPQVSPPRSCMHLSSSPNALHALLISFFLIWLPKYLVSIDHKVSHYVIFPTPPVTLSLVGPIFEVFRPFKWSITYIYMLWFYSACWSRDMTIYLVFLSFSSKPISLLMNTEAYVFSFIVCMLAPNTLRSSFSNISWCVPINFKPSWSA